MRALAPVLWLCCLCLQASQASQSKISSFFARNKSPTVATTTLSFHSQLKGFADSDSVLALSLYGYHSHASALFQQLLEGVAPSGHQPHLLSPAAIPSPVLALKEDFSRETGGFSGLPTQAAICIVSEHDVAEKSRLLSFVDYFIENAARLPTFNGHHARLVVGVIDSEAAAVTNEAKRIVQERAVSGSQVELRIIQLDDKDDAASVKQIHTALQDVAPMSVSDARSLSAWHEVVTPVERFASSECGEVATEVRASFTEKMGALTDAIQGNLMVDLGGIMDAVIEQAMTAYDEGTTAHESAIARSTVRSILMRDILTLAEPIYDQQLGLVRSVSIDEFRKAVQEIRVGPTLLSEIDQAIKSSVATFDRHAKQIRPKRVPSRSWTPNAERTKLSQTLEEYRQTAVDTARAQGLPDNVPSRKPITFTFHWLINKLPVVDFRQQVIGRFERPFLARKEDAIPPNKLTFPERMKAIQKRLEREPTIAHLKRGLLGGYIGNLFEAPNSDMQFDAERYHYIQEEVGDRFVDDDPTEVEYSKETIRDAQSYLDHARPDRYWHAMKKAAWENFDELNEQFDNAMREGYERSRKF